MPSVSRLLFALPLLLSLTACDNWHMPFQEKITKSVVPDAVVYCYKTLGRISCYQSPQENMGTFVGTQQPVVTQKTTTLEDGSVVIEQMSPAEAPPSFPMPAHP